MLGYKILYCRAWWWGCWLLAAVTVLCYHHLLPFPRSFLFFFLFWPHSMHKFTTPNAILAHIKHCMFNQPPLGVCASISFIFNLVCCVPSLSLRLPLLLLLSFEILFTCLRSDSQNSPWHCHVCSARFHTCHHHMPWLGVF